MFVTALKEIGGYFDHRWLLSALLPSLAFWAGLFVLHDAAFPQDALITVWRRQTADLQIVLAAIALGWVGFFAFLLHNFRISLIRFFEGYWGELFIPSPFTAWRKDYYQDVFDYLSEQAEYHETAIVRLEYERKQLEKELADTSLKPPLTAEQRAAKDAESTQKAADRAKLAWALGKINREQILLLPTERDDVMPTRLGNIIRAAELYPQRYGIDSVVLWPRLQALLPASFSEQMTDAETSMAFMLSVSLLSFAFSIISGVALVLSTTRLDLYLVCALGLPIALVCYLNALSSAQTYGELIKAAFDLYRRELLKSLHLEPPKTFDAEVELWETISRLLYRGDAPKSLLYEGQSPPAPKPDTWIDRATAVTASVRPVIDKAIKEEAGQQPTPPPGWLVRWPGLLVSVAKVSVESLTKEATKLWATLWPAHEQEDEPPRPGPTTKRRPWDWWSIGRVAVSVWLVVLGAAFLIQNGATPSSGIAVARINLEAGQILGPADLDLRSPGTGTPADPALMNCRMGQAVLQGADVRPDMVSPEPLLGCLVRMVEVGIPATSAMLLGDELRVGDIVDVMIVPNASPVPPTPAPAAPTTFANLVVRNVRLGSDAGAVSKPPERPYVVVVAVPDQQSQDLVARMATGAVFLTRKPASQR